MCDPPQRADWDALGTSVVLCVTESEALEQARASVERELAAIDIACSRFRPDSELSRLNASPGRWAQVSPLLAEALQLALAAARLTDGEVDPTLGRSLELCGYVRDWRLLPAPCDEPAPAAVKVRTASGWQTLQLDAAAAMVRVPRGVSLDLGATAKAWAVDRAARAAYASTQSGVLLSLGGDLAAVGPAPAQGWRIRVTDDHRSDLSAPGQTVVIRCGGLASSSTTVRRWSHDGKTMHHLLDPQTGLPAQTPWRTVSVAAADCAQANIAATAALLRGDHAAAWLGQLQLPARLVANNGRSTTVGLWPAQADEHDGRGES
ncbi:MAG TPA: FAD:protein FMN transferase [Solirubrobacteraceae bacterium]|nr:FAD:protein FMN transferase [Solirubrobacteraceae bacterium]